jgi:predicted RNase H-like HicB family nuclease
MKASAYYVKLVEWSEEDQCFVGSCPGLFYGGCHGMDETEVFIELCQLVEEMIALYQQEGKALPKPTSSKDYANLLQDVA